MRIVLHFQEPVYFEESSIWYVLDEQLTPTVNDIVVDFIKQLDCDDGWNLYVNEVIAPRWTSSTVISSENDLVKVVRTKDSNLKHSDVLNVPCDKVDPADQGISLCENQAILETSMDQSNSTTSDGNKTFGLINDKQKPPLKISNNFKRKFSDTTPTHRDRYTNRSKIFVSPGIVKNAKSSVPVAAALKTAVKETLTYSSPINVKRQISPECKTVTDSFHKARVFHDKVTTLLKAGNSAQIINVNSDSDSSMTSDSDTSSDNNSCKRNAKKARTEQNKAQNISASHTDKSSLEDKSTPDIQDTKALASILKSKEHDNIMSILKPPEKVAGILKNPEPSSTDSETRSDIEKNQSSSDENDDCNSNTCKKNSITLPKSISKKDSKSNDTDSDDSDGEKSGPNIQDSKACTSINKLKEHNADQMSVLKPSETTNQPTKVDQILIKDPKQSSTDSEAGSDQENNQSDYVENDVCNINIISKTNLSGSNKDSNDSSDDSDDEKSVPGIQDSKTCTPINKSKQSEAPCQLAKLGNILKNPEPSSTDSDEDDESNSNEIKSKSITSLNDIGKKDLNSDTSDDSDDDGISGTKEIEGNDSGSDSESEEKSGNEMHNETTRSKVYSSIKDDLMTVAQVPVSKDYSDFERLKGTPRISDKLAFKMLDLNDSYCPVISNYKEGIITEYNSASQIVVVKLLPTFVDKKQRKGKFELDEISTCSSEFLELNLKQLIEPKLLT